MPTSSKLRLAAQYLRRAGRIYMLGNGGSAATASHLTNDLCKSAKLRAFALTDNMPLFSAWANDDCYEQVFARQLELYLEKCDVVVAISGSGNSPNVLRAVETAKRIGAFTIGLTGGGMLAQSVDLAIVTPNLTMEENEDKHLALCHHLTRYCRI